MPEYRVQSERQFSQAQTKFWIVLTWAQIEPLCSEGGTTGIAALIIHAFHWWSTIPCTNGISWLPSWWFHRNMDTSSHPFSCRSTQPSRCRRHPVLRRRLLQCLICFPQLVLALCLGAVVFCLLPWCLIEPVCDNAFLSTKWTFHWVPDYRVQSVRQFSQAQAKFWIVLTWAQIEPLCSQVCPQTCIRLQRDPLVYNCLRIYLAHRIATHMKLEVRCPKAHLILQPNNIFL